MNLARFSVNRPVTAGIISLALLAIGLFYVFRMPVSLYPDVSIPFVAVSLPYPGASPEQIEAKLIKPLEAELSGIKKVSRVIAIARPGFGQIILGFKMSADGRESVESVREKVSIVRGQFPQGAKEPIVTRVDVGATPVLIYGVEAGSKPEEAKKALDETLVRALQRTEGINEARVIGLGEELIELALDAEKLSSLRVAPLDIYEQLSAKMAIVPWGDVIEQGRIISVARGVLPADLEYWSNQVVTLRDGRGVRLAEVGTVRKSRKEETARVLINGQRGLGLVITKRSDANTVDTVRRAQGVIAKAALPDGVKLFSIVNQRDYIEENAHEVWIALFVGGAFAILVILVFLTDVKSALISATALPVSIAGSFIFMSALGFSLNMMSLLALALAIGLLIDDAVVVRESIYSEMEKGVPAREAAITGTDKVSSAVLATTLAVVAVFLPVGLMDGLVGQFFKQFGLTICISVLLSLWVAFTLDPMLSSIFSGRPKPLQGKLWDAWRGFLSRTERAIATTARRSFRSPWLVIMTAIAALAGASYLVLARGADFLAFEDRGQFVLNMRTPVGTPRDESEKTVNDAINRLRGLEGLKNVYASVGDDRDETLSLLRFVFSAKTERKKGLIELQSEARSRLQGLKAEWLVMDPPPIEGIGGEAPLAVYVYGENLETLRPVTEGVLKQILAVKGVANARVETAAFGPAIEIELRPQDLGFAGSGSQAVELSGRLALTGLEAGSVGADNTPFFVRFQKSDRTLSSLWDSLMIPSQRGPMFVNQFADAKQASLATAIDREKRSRKMVIWGALDRTRTFGAVLADIQAIVDNVKQPFFAEVGGDKEIFEEMMSSFAIAIVGSLFFIFVILAAQFENLLRPFVILLSLPLAIIGGFVALWLAGLQLALGALIGLVLLIGLAAKNGILLVDAVGVKEKMMSLEDAVYESVLERSRPILMTSIAMIFGMIPTAVMRGGGSEFRSPMAITIIGGVISSTLLSFLVVPAVFGLIGSIRRLFFKDKGSILALKPEIGAVLLVTLSGGYALLQSQEGRAQPAQPAQPAPPVRATTTGLKVNTALFEMPTADMSLVLTLLRDVRAGSAELTSIESAQVGSQGATQASRLAFLGGARVELGREWYRPGVTNEFSIPVFSPLTGKIEVFSQSSIVVPKAQNILSLGWQIPIINMQSFYGLQMADVLHAQVPLMIDAKYESATLNYAQILLQAELARQSERVNESYVKNALARQKTIQERKTAGLATKLDESQVIAMVQVAVVQWEQAKVEAARLRKVFELHSGKSLPLQGTGLTVFPFAGDKTFQSTAVRALEGAYNVQKKSVELTDAAFYPTLALELGYQGKYYQGPAPDPQKYVGIKAQWNILDGGLRVRNVAQGQQQTLDLLAQKQDLEIQLQSNYATLGIRREGLMRALASARVSQRAAATAQEQSVDSLRAGLLKANDVRTADEGRLRADFAILQIEFALQALAIESLALTGEWNKFLQSSR